jgi:hypothetical protein
MSTAPDLRPRLRPDTSPSLERILETALGESAERRNRCDTQPPSYSVEQAR